jgi:hypothetical protein
MNDTQEYPSPYNAEGQFDPQGFLGALLGGAAGRVIGKAIGGSTGQTIGGWAGKIGGGFLPLGADPTAQAAPTDLEMQGFWNVLKKIAQGAQTGINVGKQLGVFQAGAPGGGEQAGPTDLEMQGFWNVLKKIGQGVGTGLNVGKQLGIFEAGTPSAGASQEQQLVALLQQALPALQAIAQTPPGYTIH